MADLELESTGNTAEQRTWLIATPHDLGPDHLKDFVGENILEVKPGTTLLNSQHSTFGGIFAMGSRSGVGVLGQGTDNVGVHGRSTNGVGVWGHGAGAREGVLGDSLNSHGVVGVTGSANAGVMGRNLSFEGPGVQGEGGPGGIGVLGIGENAGVVGRNPGGGSGVRGEGGPGGTAILGIAPEVPPGNPGGNGILGIGTGGLGIGGEGGIGVRGTADVDLGIGVLGIVGSPPGIGSPTKELIRGTAVSARTNTGIGVDSASNGNIGVWGRSDSNTGVAGDSDSNKGVAGFSNSGIGVYGTTGFGSDTARAASFRGPVDVGGHLEVFGTLDVDTGIKNFKIDHPLDPKNKYLLHTCVESSEMKNVYDGIAQLDEDGAAWVDLPEWFEALNGDFRYQLTAVGGAAPNLHVAEEMYENRFKIAGGERGMKVCWQVTGARKDPWAAANPFEVEQEKPERDQGRYLQPDLYGAPEEQRVMRTFASTGDAAGL